METAYKMKAIRKKLGEQKKNASEFFFISCCYNRYFVFIKGRAHSDIMDSVPNVDCKMSVVGLLCHETTQGTPVFKEGKDVADFLVDAEEFSAT